MDLDSRKWHYGCMDMPQQNSISSAEALSDSEFSALEKYIGQSRSRNFRVAIVFLVTAVVLFGVYAFTKIYQVLVFGIALALLAGYLSYNGRKSPTDAELFSKRASATKQRLTGNWSYMQQNGQRQERMVTASGGYWGLYVGDARFSFLDTSVKPIEWTQRLAPYKDRQLTLTYCSLYPNIPLRVESDTNEVIYDILAV